MLIGGTAVALNGYYRHSLNSAEELTSKPDVDIWYQPTYENYFNVLKVIGELGQDITEFQEEQSPNPKNIFYLYTLFWAKYQKVLYFEIV